jgi:hypothetical protein
MLASEDVAAFLNGYAALWHPAALHGAAAPPRITSAYDYEQPVRGHVYALPESPPPLLPDDWDERVRAAGAVAFRATADRAATVANMLAALRASPPALEPQAPTLHAQDLLDLDPARVGPFLGIGFGQRMVESLFEAMEHEQVLSAADFWLDVQAAVAALANPDPDAWLRHLRAAAERLQAAREVVYPVTIHLLDLWLADEDHPAATLPASFGGVVPANVIASAALLERLESDAPEQFDAFRDCVGRDEAEICGGPYQEREDALLPIESQLWNLRVGMAVYRRLLGQEVRVFARRRFAAHPQLPLLLNHVGLRRALLVPFDESVLPTYRVTVVNWPSPDGKQVEAFVRAPHRADEPLTFFHWTHYLHRTIAQDHGATLALLHAATPAAASYADLLHLSRLAPVLGQWTTLTRYFNDVLAGEYISAPAADEFHGDYLTERTTARRDRPVSWFASHLRQRRHLDTARTLAALNRALGRSATPSAGDSTWEERVAGAEERIEQGQADGSPDAVELEREAAQALAERLVARAPEETPGYLLLNPCSFTRRVGIELEAGPLPVTGPVKALQVDGEKARLVVEVPALGFAWIPRQGPAGTPVPASRMRLADATHVRNEFFEAEIDPTTGGLRGLRDPRTRNNRIGQQLVFNPGSTMRAKEIRVISAGPALGEVVSEGALLDEQGAVLALFRQRFRAWLGRPMLELRLEIYPEHPPQGYPWHAYYGARFAWRDERATLLRGVNGAGYLTSHTRPETPDYLEIRLGRQSTALFPGGLPFHQRHGGRMLDVVLIPEGETASGFDLGLGLDREYPMQTALGMVTPLTVVPTRKGPPHVGSVGWLFHLDAPNLLLTSLWPAADGADAVFARLLECNQYAGQAELRCPRDPQRAEILDEQGNIVTAASTAGDAVLFETPPGDLLRLRIDFARP